MPVIDIQTGYDNRSHNLSSPQDYSEGWAFRDAQGVEYLLDRVAGRYVMSWDGDGLPPIEYVTQRGPFQHGETVNDYFLRPRIIQMLVRRQYNSRTRYWDGRNSFLDMIRPNRQLLGLLNTGAIIITRPDGTRRALDCFVTEGPKFQPRDNRQWQSRQWEEVIRFTGFNPVWYDPVQQCLEATPTDLELVFPITFPIMFGSLDQYLDIPYRGTWEEYPEIRIQGPIINPYIENATTGERLQLIYSVPAGETLVFNLQYGHKTVATAPPDDGDVALMLGGSISGEQGTNLVGYLTTDSDLATFHLATDPTAPGGINQIHVNGNGVTEATKITVCWYNRYIGI